jgi:hypothetical protein
MEEHRSQEAHNEAWERYMEAERKELRMRKDGHLAKMLGLALPDETPGQIARLAEEDRLRALEGLVEMMDEQGEITYEPLEDLTPEDRTSRTRAEGVRVEWIAERQARRPLPPIPGPIGP